MNRCSPHVVTLVVMALLGMVALAWAQQLEPKAEKPNGQAETAGQPAAPGTAEADTTTQNDDDDERVKLLNADSLFRDKAAGVYYCKGNVVFSHKDVLLYCDEAEYYDETDSARATGNLKIVDPEATITGDLLTANFEDEIVVVTGNVRVVAQKKKDENGNGQGNGGPQAGETDQEEKKSEEPDRLEEYAERSTTITCEKLEYHYNEDIKKAIATGNVKAVQEDKTVWADTAVYEQLTDEITLTGNVRLKTDDGDELFTQEAVVSIAEDWIRTGQVSGVTFRRKDDADNNNAD